jgi:hypothetical protein
MVETESLEQQSKLPLFITWGGELSRRIAEFLHDWLPDVIQSVDPFFSSDSIRKGQFWFNEIETRLRMSRFGLAVVTRDAMSHPWVHFEVGALAMFAGQSRTATLLIDVNATELPGALRQIQATSIDDKADFLKLVKDINAATTPPLENDRLLRLYERSWDELEQAVNGARTDTDTAPAPARTFIESALDELLTLSREQSRLLSHAGQRSIVERLSGPGNARGPLRRHLRDLMSANPSLVQEEMERWFGSPRPALNDEDT